MGNQAEKSADTQLEYAAAQGNAQQLLQSQLGAANVANMSNQAQLAQQQAQAQDIRAGQQLGLGNYQAQLQAQTGRANALLAALTNPYSHSQSTSFQAPTTGGGSPAGPYKDWGQDLSQAFPFGNNQGGQQASLAALNTPDVFGQYMTS
jgi:hypothetical protein